MVLDNLTSDHLWVYLCVVAMIFTGIRGFQRKHQATAIKHHQHLHLISTITTTLICAVIILIRQPEIPEQYSLFFGLCLINGLGYALAGVCNYGAVKHLKLSTFQSVSKLSAFLPIIVFYFVLGEKVSGVEMIGILLAIFPIMMLTYVEPGDSADSKNPKDIWRGTSFLIIYLLVTSAMQIVSVMVVKDNVNYSLGADPFLFLMCTNALSLPYAIFMIIKTKEKVELTFPDIKAGISAGVINTISICSLLLAISLGPASIVLPLYAYNSFISITLLKVFPVSKPAPMSKHSIAILAFLVLWSAISIIILLQG